MKLALFVPGGVDRSGVDRVVPALLWQVERLARRHTVHIFALRQEADPGHWNLLGANVHNIGTGNGRRRRLLSWFNAEHKREPFDVMPVSYTHLRAHETGRNLVCRLLL